MTDSTPGAGVMQEETRDPVLGDPGLSALAVQLCRRLHRWLEADGAGFGLVGGEGEGAAVDGLPVVGAAILIDLGGDGVGTGRGGDALLVAGAELEAGARGARERQEDG